MEEKLDYGYMNQICSYYENCDESINATAKHFGINRSKVRKILITLGVISNEFSEEAEKLREQGLSIQEIADKLDCSISTVSTYLPYTSIMYKGEEKSLNAIRMENFRQRVKTAKNNTKKSRISEERAKEMEELKNKLEAEQQKKTDRTEDKFTDSVKGHYYPGLVNDRHFLPEEFGEDVLANSKCDEVFRLHLELIDTDNLGFEIDEKKYPWDREVTDALHKYGGVKFGDHISRDILVPGDIQLWALHYMIQRAFGWQNSHLHRFYLSGERLKEITDNKVGNWANLVGLVFRDPLMDEYAEFWADNYKSGSFKTWLRKKYTGPYYCLNQWESYWFIRNRAQDYQDYSEMENPDSFGGIDPHKPGKDRNEKYVVRWGQYKEDGENHLFVKDCYPESRRKEVENRDNELAKKYPERMEDVVKVETIPWKDLPIDALRLLYERDPNELLERQEIQFVLAMGERGLPENGYDFVDDSEYCKDYNEQMRDAQDSLEMLDDDEDSPINQPDVGGVAKELYYEYDFGDSWTVKITGSYNCADLVESGRVTQEELDEANLRVRNTYRPVMICRDGTDLVDDMGGYASIAHFLRAVNGDFTNDNQQYEDKESTIEWAKSLGWSTRNVALKNRL